MVEKIKNYGRIVKPGIVFGNLITAAGGFFLAAKGRIEIAMLLPTVGGISLVVASGCVFNNCIDRDLDRKMARTRNRVLARRLISPKSAAFYAVLLGFGGLSMLRAAANMACVAVVLGGFMIYVGVYSLYLKRRTAYSTLIGSLAGAAPPLAGYCAAAGGFDPGALILLIIFSLWQIPHAYAIAVFRCDEYAAAALPVLPGKQGGSAAKPHMVAAVMVFAAAAPLPTLAGYTGFFYLAAAVAMGLSWLVLAWWEAPDVRAWSRRLFLFSILTIAVLSLMMSVDAAGPVVSPLLLSRTP